MNKPTKLKAKWKFDTAYELNLKDDSANNAMDEAIVSMAETLQAAVWVLKLQLDKEGVSINDIPVSQEGVEQLDAIMIRGGITDTEIRWMVQYWWSKGEVQKLINNPNWLPNIREINKRIYDKLMEAAE
jgi:hypothetical protein